VDTWRVSYDGVNEAPVWAADTDQLAIHREDRRPVDTPAVDGAQIPAQFPGNIQILSARSLSQGCLNRRRPARHKFGVDAAGEWAIVLVGGVIRRNALVEIRARTETAFFMFVAPTDLFDSSNFKPGQCKPGKDCYRYFVCR
jgi:hypothetical protein